MPPQELYDADVLLVAQEEAWRKHDNARRLADIKNRAVKIKAKIDELETGYSVRLMPSEPPVKSEPCTQ
jgi:hypothetical protein